MAVDKKLMLQMVQHAVNKRLELDRALRSIEAYVGHDVDGLDNLIDESAPGADMSVVDAVLELADDQQPIPLSLPVQARRHREKRKKEANNA